MVLKLPKQENGIVSYAEGENITLAAGSETDLITVRFIAEDGDRFVPDESEGYGLAWAVGNESITEVEQHEEDGAWSFHMVGLAAGDTDVQFMLMHIDHEDFTSLPFAVQVTEAIAGN